MLFHANDIENRAVWNAMKIHAELMEEAGESIVYVVKEENIEIVKSSIEDSTILSYANQFELMKKTFTHADQKIFSPDMFSAVSMALSVLFKNKKVYYWVQGAVPQESYMRNKSKIRRAMLLSIEYLAIKLSRYHILVSSYMKTFYEAKHSFGLNPIVAPCTSDLSFTDIKKEKNSFVYVGGLSAWQKFDQILRMFNKVFEQNNEAKLYIATGDTKNAEALCSELLTKEALGHVSIQNIATREEMTSFLNTKEYGFLIREDDIVNNVASPIKLAEYLSTGVNVIISSSLTSYAQEVEDSQAGIMVHSVEDIEKIKHTTANSKNALALYEKLFSREVLVKEYQSIL